MFIEISIGNYKSIRDIVNFSLVAANIREHEDNNVFSYEKENISLLKSSVIYGANASGKSNFIEAIAFMQHFILFSHEGSENDKIPIVPFQLDDISKNIPSFFECIFIIDDVRYRYGFKVDKIEIHEEWLYSYPNKKERMLFRRNKQTIKIGNNFTKEAKKFVDHVRKNTLFLSILTQLKVEIAIKLCDWFREKVAIISGLDDKQYGSFTLGFFEEGKYKDKIIKFLKIADVDINNILVNKVDTNAFIEEVKKHNKEKAEEIKNKIEKLSKVGELVTVKSIHRKYDKEKEGFIEVEFELEDAESKGTQKLFNIAGPILDTLENGITLFIDELDTRFHPLITKYIISLFNSKLNSKNAQLVFVCHDACLLDKNIFRRDQIWFAEKDRDRSTKLYSLVEFKKQEKKVRKDSSYFKNYLLGNYGAVPYIDDITSLFD